MEENELYDDYVVGDTSEEDIYHNKQIRADLQELREVRAKIKELSYHAECLKLMISGALSKLFQTTDLNDVDRTEELLEAIVFFRKYLDGTLKPPE